MLQVGTLTGAGLALPDLLKLRATAAGSEAPKQRSAILVYLPGGPSHIESFDPKPDAQAEIRGPFNPIATSVPGIQISETLPQLAKIADKYSLIRSCCHDNSGHGGGQRYVQTGYKSASLEDELPHDYPAFGSIVSKIRGPMHGGLPTYIHVPNGSDGGAKYLGNAYNGLKRYDEAANALKKSSEIEPTNASAHFNLGLTLYNAGRYSEAIESYKEVIKLRPKLPQAYFNLGLTYSAINDKTQAMAQYETLKGLDAEMAKQLYDAIRH